MKKRILSMVLCLSLLVATFATTMVVSAADDIREDGYCAEIKDYREEGNFTAPTKEGKVFAGWYTDGTFETAIAPSVTEGEAWAKFVNPTVFTIKNQFNEGAHKTSETVDLRIITTIDSEWYAGIEFTFTCEDFGTKTFPIDTVYTSLVNYESASAAFCSDSAFFAVEKITGIPAEVYTKKMSITPIFTTYDGTEFVGTTRGTEEEPLVLKDKLPLGTTTFDVHHGWMSGSNWTNPIYINASIKNDIGHNVTCYPAWENGGIYVDGVKTSLTIVKHNDYGYYIPLTSLYDEMTVTIQGTFTYDGQKVIVAPVTFKFDVEDTTDTAEGTWQVVSREALTEESIGFAAFDRPHSTDSKTIWFTTNAEDALGFDSVVSYRTAFVEGGIYVEREMASADFVKYGSTHYYISLSADAEIGTRVTLQGVLQSGDKQVKFQSTTFEYKGNNVWEMVSNEPIIPISVAVTVKPIWIDNGFSSATALFFSNNAVDGLDNTAGVTTYYPSNWEVGGIYVGGEKVSANLVKRGSVEHYIDLGSAGVSATEGTSVKIEGIITDGTRAVKYQSTTFVYTNGAWTLAS